MDGSVVTPQKIEAFRIGLSQPIPPAEDRTEFLKALAMKLMFIKESDPDFTQIIVNTNVLLHNIHETLFIKRQGFTTDLNKTLRKLCSESNALSNLVRKSQEPETNTIFLDKTSEPDFYDGVKLIGDKIWELAPRIGTLLSSF